MCDSQALNPGGGVTPKLVFFPLLHAVSEGNTGHSVRVCLLLMVADPAGTPSTSLDLATSA